MASTDNRVQIVRHELRQRLLSVSNTEPVTPRMLRVTLTGDDLEGFRSLSPADHIKLCFPEPDAEQPIMPTRGLKTDDGPQPTIRDYSVRAFRPDALELDVDFVLHGSGPAVTWATQAKPGRLVGVLGPRGSRVVAHDFDWYLLAGDETALPAIGRWVSELPEGARVLAVIEVAAASEEQTFESAADLSVQWLHRNGRAAGTTTLLEDAIRGLTLPSGDGYVWLAGEAGTLKPIRRYLRNDLGLNPDRVAVDGYWKYGVVNFDHHQPIDDEEQ